MVESKYEKIMEVAKNRGFIWPSFEIYGGAAGFYDLGPLGSSLKDKILDKWRQYYVVKEGCLEIDSPNIFPKEVLKASGHVDHFTDVMVECESCSATYEVTDLVEEMTGQDVEGKSKEEIENIIEQNRITCPKCGGSLANIHDFNTMFRTAIGPEEDREAYLRPETAQTIFVDFNRLQRVARRQLPFGVAQIGRGYRNEISPRKGIIRLREFSMAEVEVFYDPESPSHPKFERVKDEQLKLWTAENQEKGLENYIKVSTGEAVDEGLIFNELLAYHMAFAKKFLLSLGIPESEIRLREQVSGERAHYSKETWDLEVKTEDFGWVEVAGLAYRTDYDLSKHSEASKTDLTVYHQKSGEDEGKKVLPHVVEPSFGVDRTLYCVMEHSFNETDDREYFQFNRELAPIEAYVFPLITSDGLPEEGREILRSLRDSGIFARYDDSGSIGRRYARADEIGVPYCITIDHQTLEDSTVTIRDRDSTEQIRVPVDELSKKVKELLGKKIQFKKAGDPV
ncbi:hypothetical protein AKJ56_00680 [candidate division MSBL1 archaeon SCGC-AAA382N08]|uniref:glycine--tRNA ligase n=1 Tax=candidate division MSBL1 archaeon SCGC-AAA382N08 TaxID=1698285 RepID=A0A133VQG7_9EURY|nr:hypothetical protein AKJ56_00680 [candidate division MSBL1 archaeon SCGC-AAA382N08]